jgi:hypothetical protein
VESDYDPEVGYTVSFTHIEESGVYTCSVIDAPDHFIEFQVTVNCEFNCNRKVRSIFNEENLFTTNISVNIYELLLGDGPFKSYDNISNVTTQSKLKDKELAQRLDRMLNKTLNKPNNNMGLCCVKCCL